MRGQAREIAEGSDLISSIMSRLWAKPHYMTIVAIAEVWGFTPPTVRSRILRWRQRSP